MIYNLNYHRMNKKWLTIRNYRILVIIKNIKYQCYKIKVMMIKKKLMNYNNNYKKKIKLLNFLNSFNKNINNKMHKV